MENDLFRGSEIRINDLQLN